MRVLINTPCCTRQLKLAFQEILSGKMPYAHYEGAFAIYMVFNAISSKELPKRPDNLSSSGDKVWETCQGCWNFEPGERMTVEQAIVVLQSMRNISPPDNAAIKPVRPKRGLRLFFTSIVNWAKAFNS